MNTFDSQLAGQLHDLVDHEPDAAPSTGILLQQWQGRRTRRRRMVAVVSASCAVLALGAITAAAIAPPSTPNRPSITAEAASPQLELASAITASENISYKVKVTDTPIAPPGVTLTDEQRKGSMTEGAFDPATATGYLRSPFPDADAYYEERLIDGVRIVGATGAGFKQYPGKHDSLAYDQALGGALGATADPGTLLQTLKAHGSISETAPNVYQFKVTSGEYHTLTGEVTVEASSNRVAQISFERESTVTKGGLSETSRNRVTIEFSDYGTPVKVERPADVVIVK